MNSRLSAWKIRGVIFTAIFGVLLHFLYDWTNQNGIVSLFSAVNESTWEHMKLLFFPMFVFSFIDGKYNSSKYMNFYWSKLLGTMLGTLMIPVLFYTINGAFGKTPDWVNILIFFISVLVAYFVEFKIIINGKNGQLSEKKSLLILCALALIFVIFTYYPPKLPVFLDPVSMKYGM